MFMRGVALAHDPFSSWANVHVRPDEVQVEVTMGRASALALLGYTEPFPVFDETTFESFSARLKEQGPALYTITGGGKSLALRRVAVGLADEQDVHFNLFFAPPDTAPLQLRADYVSKMAEGHVATVYVTDAAENNLGWGELSVENLMLETPLSVVKSDAATEAPLTSPNFTTFLKLGVKHILTGYDHLLFLGGLLVVCHRLRDVITIITCFTIAHSVTLAMAALGLVTVPGRVVEPLIAASIIFVGVENLLRRGEPKWRWLVTSAFGLIHGLGFASALVNIGLGANGTPMLVPLISFNLGVELGQLAVAAICLPILWRLQKWPAFTRYGVPIMSVVVALAGAYWLLQRTFFAS